MTEADLIYDWNRQHGPVAWPAEPEVLDLTLWEAGHCPEALQPSLADRIDLLHRMGELGINAACVGSAATTAWPEALALLSEWADSRLTVRPACLCQPEREQLDRVLEAAQGVSVLLEAGVSPLEEWKGRQHLLHRLEVLRECALYASGHGLTVTVLCPDVAQAPPDFLIALWSTAIQAGASRLALVDSTGFATPPGAARLVQFAREVVRRLGREVGLDWHGYNDRGLALANALTALEAGAQRVHASALGLAERAGCVPLDLLLVNLRLLGAVDRPMEALAGYCQQVAAACKVDVLPNYPVLGQDAFRTGTGVHAAAIVKAERKGFSALADLIYSGVPAGMFGFEQVIEVGPMAGESNVLFWLRKQGLEPTPERVEAIMGLAKSSDHVLTDREIREALGEPVVTP
ncbi:MAG: 2-isopropylmalate synthase [Candidatus Eremiobacterota bacterium]